MACAQCGKPSRGIELDHGNNPFYVGDYFSPPRVNICGCSEGESILSTTSQPTSKPEDSKEAKKDEEPGAPNVPEIGQLISKEVTVKTTSGEHTLKTARFVNSFKSSPNNPFDITSKAALPNVKKIVTQKKRVDLSSEKAQSVWDVLKDVELSCQPRFLWDTEMVFKNSQVIEDQLETKTEIVVTMPPESVDPSSDNSSLASYSSAVSEQPVASPNELPQVEVVTTKTRTTKFMGPQMSPNNPFDVNEKPLRKVDLAAIRFGMCIRGRKYPARMEDLIDGSPLKPRLLSFQ